MSQQVRQYVKLGDVWKLAGSKILDETFDTDFSAFEAPHSSWGVNTDLADFSIVDGVGRVGSASERALYVPETVKNSLQIATVRAGSADAANRFRLKSLVIAGEATAIDFNWVATTSGSFGVRTFVVDDGVTSAALNTYTLTSVVGEYYTLVMFTMGEFCCARVNPMGTSTDLRGEWTSTGGSMSLTGTTDALAGWAAEHNYDQPGGGFMLSATGAQNTGATPAQLLRWEIWDLGT